MAFDKERFAKMYLANSCNMSATCRKFKVSRTHIYRLMEADEAFKEAIEDAKEEMIDDAEDQLRKAVKKGNITAIIFTLKTQAKDRGYVEKVESDVNLTNLEPTQVLLPDNNR